MFIDIKGYEGRYKVSDKGEVFSTPKDGKPKKLLNQELIIRNHTNYRRVSLSSGGIVKRFQVHRLVGKAFISNPEGKECINHLDNNGENNSVGNLEWCTYSENMAHSRKQGRQKEVQRLGGIAAGKLKTANRLKLLNSLIGKKFGHRIMLGINSLGKHPKGSYKCLLCNSIFQGTISTVLSDFKKGKYLACRPCSLKHGNKQH